MKKLLFVIWIISIGFGTQLFAQTWDHLSDLNLAFRSFTSCDSGKLGSKAYRVEIRAASITTVSRSTREMKIFTPALQVPHNGIKADVKVPKWVVGQVGVTFGLWNNVNGNRTNVTNSPIVYVSPSDTFNTVSFLPPYTNALFNELDIVVSYPPSDGTTNTKVVFIDNISLVNDTVVTVIDSGYVQPTQNVSSIITTNPSGLQVIIDGATYTSPQTFSWVQGSQHSVGAISPQINYVYSSWSDNGAQSHTITATNGTFTANFTQQSTTVSTIVTTNPSGLQVTVDGTTYSAPHTFSWEQGSQHTVAVTSPQGNASTQQIFGSWSDNGAQSHAITATNGTFTANFQTQHYLTMQSGGNGTVLPASGWYNAGQTVQISATVIANCVFTSWSGSGTGSYSGTSNPATITMNGPITELANFTVIPPQTVSTIIATSPSGLQVIVDGVTYTTPKTCTWSIGSTHVINAEQQGNTNTKQIFNSWSDGGTASHSIVATNTTFTANFQTQYYLTMQSGGNGTVLPISGWYNAGQTVQISATPNTNYEFTSWSGSGAGSYTGTSNPGVVSMNGPIVESASFAQAIQTVSTIVTTNPSGLQMTIDGAIYVAPHTFIWTQNSQHTVGVNTPQGNYAYSSWSDGGAQTHSITATGGTITANFSQIQSQTSIITFLANTDGLKVLVDGIEYVTPKTFTWAIGSQHSIGMNTQQGNTGTQYVFSSWGDGGAQSHTITTPSSATTYTAYFTTQFYLTMQSSGNGTVSPASGWYNAGQTVQISATPNANYNFSSWNGTGIISYTGSNNPASITMSGSQITEVANFVVQTPQTVSTIITTNPTGLQVIIDGATFNTPHTFSWVQNSQHAVGVNSPQGNYAYSSWSDGGAQVHSINAVNGTITANFLQIQNQDPPAVPILNSPANGSVGQSLTTTLYWSASQRATSYKLHVVTAFGVTVIDKAISGTSYQLNGYADGIIGGVTYYWRVKAINNFGESEWTSSWNFTTEIPTFNSPQLISPSNGATGIPVRPTFNWTNPLGTNSCELQILNVNMTIVMERTISVSSFAVTTSLQNNTMYYWRVRASNGVTTSAWSDLWQFTTVTTTTGIKNQSDISQFELYQNYPNPFNPSTNICFSVGKQSFISLKVYDGLGREVETLVYGIKNAGNYEVKFDASRMPSGTYWYILQSEGKREVRKMNLIK